MPKKVLSMCISGRRIDIAEGTYINGILSIGKLFTVLCEEDVLESKSASLKLRLALKEHKVKTRRVNIIYDTAQSLIYDFDLPISPYKYLEDVARLEIEKIFPKFEGIVTLKKITAENGIPLMRTAAISKTACDYFYKLARDSRLNPISLEYAETATERFAEFNTDDKWRGCILVNISERYFKLYLIQKQKIIYKRTVETKSSDISEQIIVEINKILKYCSQRPEIHIESVFLSERSYASGGSAAITVENQKAVVYPVDKVANISIPDDVNLGEYINAVAGLII